MTSVKKEKKKPLGKRIRSFFRRKVFSKRAMEGSVTIFLIIIMLPMLIFSCSVVDLCKIFMAKNSTQSALELAMNSRLASYDDVLKDMYGLIASSADEAELSEKLSAYYKMTLESSTGFTMDGEDEKYIENFINQLLGADVDSLNESIKDTNGWLNLFENAVGEGLDSFSVTPVVTSSVSNPEIMHKQIVDYMKYRGPVYMVTGVMDKLNAFGDVSNQTKAAQAQVDFEKAMKDTGDAFESVYNELKKFLDTSTNFENQYPFSSFYRGGNLCLPKDIEDKLQESVASAYVCSYLAPSFDSNGKLSFTKDVENAFEKTESESKEITDAADELDDKLHMTSGVEGKADDVTEIFKSTSYGTDFMNEANKNINSENLLKDFGVLFNKMPKDENVNKNVLLLLEAYTKARQYENYLNKHSDEEAMDALKEVLDRAEPVVDSIKDAADAIKTHMEAEYQNANKNYEAAADKMNKIHDIVEAQITSLNYLLGSEGIDNIIGKLSTAQGMTGDYETAVGAIKTESEKAAMTETYNSSAAKVKELNLSGEAVNGFKAILSDLRYIYQNAKSLLESTKFFGQSPVSDSVDLGKTLTKFRNGQSGSSTWYNYNNDLSSATYFSTEEKSVENIGAWNSKNKEITDSELGEIITKNGQNKSSSSQAAKDEAKKMKEDIKDAGSKAGADNSKDSESSPEVDDNNDEETCFIPKNYPTFEGYVNAAKELCNDGNTTDENLKALNEKSFSTETTSSENVGNNGEIDSNIGDDPGNASNALGAIGDFFSNLLKAARDDIYIAEYLTENFPCFTTLQEDPNAEMMSGMKFKENDKANIVCSKSSLEYILYGNTTGGKEEAALSVAKASAVIFGVRFALNLVYALTSPTLAAWVEPIIAPLEAVPFAAPLARTVILIGLSLAESAVDISLLLANQEVALFKSDSTWVCSPGGIVNNVVGKVKDVAVDKAQDAINNAISDATGKAVSKLTEAEDKLAEKIKNASGNVTEQCADEIKEYSAQVTEQLKNQIESDVWNPFVTVIKDAIDDFDNDLQEKIGASAIKGKLDSALETATNNDNLGLDSVEEGDIVAEIEKQIFDEIKGQTSTIAESISSHLGELSSTVKEGILESVDSFDNKVKDVLSNVENKINEYVGEGTDKLKSKVDKAVESMVDDISKDLKGKTEDLGNTVKGKLKTGLNNALKGKPATETKSTGVSLAKDKPKAEGNSNSDKLITDKDGDSTKKTLAVSYKDYLLVFTVIGLAINEDHMLMRAAQLMNANIELKVFESTRAEELSNAYSSDANYDINKAYTLFKGEAGSKTRTIFFGTTWSKEEQKWVHPASNVYTYTAKTYVGY